MKYRRALLLADLASDIRASLSALRRVAPELERLLIVAGVPAPSFASLLGESSAEPDTGTIYLLDELRESAAEAAPNIDVQLAPEVNAHALHDLALAAHVDVVVAGTRSLRTASVLVEVRKQLVLPLLWPGDTTSPAGRIRHVCCIALGRSAQASIATFLRDHADPALHVTVLSSAAPAADALEGVLEVAGVHSSVEVPEPSMASIRHWLAERTSGGDIDLVVLTRVPTVLLASFSWPAPVLLLPSPPSDVHVPQRAIDIADVMDDGGQIRARIDYAAVVGSLPPVPEQALAFVSEGRVVAQATTTRSGEVTLPSGINANSLGVFRVRDEAPFDVLAAIEQWITVVRPGKRPLVLFDSELSDERLRVVHGVCEARNADALAVRLRPARTCVSIRDRLRPMKLPPHVIDGRAVLDEGDALDISEANDPVRLGRVASRLNRAGFRVSGILYRDLTEPEPPPSSRADPIGGNHIELELDNTKARRWLLESIANSRKTVHLQVYMAVDDDIGRPVEAALAEAAARGVAVRVLVDSLHGRHGSFGAENPVLSRLLTRTGVELRISRPLRELPSLTDLKQRDHRKIVIVDDSVALIGGRNLSHEYYTGFDEAHVTPTTPWRQVPWLDAGARIEGPAVAAVASSFLEAWTEAGGTAFDIVSPPPAGTITARVVVHRGLRDAHTLEAYLELIDAARSHIYAVNGFPFMLELQHALLRSIRRGVRVRALTGHLTPTHAGRPFSGPWSSARRAATEFVHSRLDPLVESGGEAYFFAKRDVPGWDPSLGVVYPHVHAKVMSVDGERCAVGSANLDFTSAYWESELLLVVDDARLTQNLEMQIEELIADSTHWHRDDPSWQTVASRRKWMRRWPGVLSI